MKNFNFTKVVLFLSLAGFIGFSVFESLLHADKIADKIILFFGRITIINNPSTDVGTSPDIKKAAVDVHSDSKKPEATSVITEPPREVKISHDAEPSEPKEVSQPVATQKISQDMAAKPFSKDSAPENFSFTGWLKTRNSKDTHTFMLSHPCVANISFTPSEGDKASYVLTIGGDSVLTQKVIDSSNFYADTGNLYLRAGTYTVNIERGYSWSGKPYRITVSTSRIANTEEEGNNTPQTANVIPLNENVRASTGTRNDGDYFTFTLDRPMMICPHLEFNEVSNGKEIYSLKLYELAILGTDKDPFTFRGDCKPSKKISPFILDAGKYIIVISRIEDTEKLELGLHEYTLRVEAREIM